MGENSVGMGYRRESVRQGGGERNKKQRWGRGRTDQSAGGGKRGKKERRKEGPILVSEEG